MLKNLGFIILAAGLGTRMKSRKAKVLHQVLGVPMVTYPTELALSLEAEKIALVLGYQQDLVRKVIEDRFDSESLEFYIQEQQLGTADAVLAASAAFKDFSGVIGILSGDVPAASKQLIEQLISEYEKTDSPVALISTVVDNPYGYGRIVRDKTGNILKIVEHKCATPEQKKIAEINAGLYLVDSKFLWTHLSSINSDNQQGEFFLTDLVALAAKEGPVGEVIASDPSEVGGINTRRQLADASKILQNRKNGELMDKGVTIIDPDRTIIESQVKIGQDTEIYPGVRISGASVIGSDCIIEDGSIIVNSTIGNGVHIYPYSHLEDVEIHNNALVGPFARLRPGAVMHDNSKVGNFVEMKKTVLGEGSKASHLTYLGDATIGKKVNIGAGTITCNYDGYVKHETIMEDGVFIGSDTQLVAPVTIGKGAVVGAGTTVTKKVSADSLVISRVRQTEIPGYAVRWRKQGKKAKEERSK